MKTPEERDVFNVPMSMSSYCWMQDLKLFQHVSFQNLFHLVHSKVHDGANMCNS